MSKEDFEYWWHEEGSGMRPLPEEDTEAFAKRICEIAWSNGEYIAGEKKDHYGIAHSAYGNPELLRGLTDKVISEGRGVLLIGSGDSDWPKTKSLSEIIKEIQPEQAWFPNPHGAKPQGCVEYLCGAD